MRAGFAIFFCAAMAAWSQPRGMGPALEGLDPVLLTEGKDVDGLDSLTVKRGEFTYRFSTEETRDRFNKDPERYAIQLDGACARMGAPAHGNPNAYVVHEGRIYILSTPDCYKHFKAEPKRYLERPAPVWNPSAADRA